MVVDYPKVFSIWISDFFDSFNDYVDLNSPNQAKFYHHYMGEDSTSIMLSHLLRNDELIQELGPSHLIMRQLFLKSHQGSGSLYHELFCHTKSRDYYSEGDFFYNLFRLGV